MINIRSATVQDVPIILALIKDLATFEKLTHEVTATEDVLKKTLFGSHKSAEVLIAEENAKPLGCAIFFHNFSTFLGKPGLYLEDLFVKPEARGKGIGMALLSKLAQIAMERECGRMEWSVLDWNTKAIDLYKSIGAKSMDEWVTMRLVGDDLKKLAAHN